MIKAFLWIQCFFLTCVAMMSINIVSAQSGDLDGILNTLNNKDLRIELVKVSPSQPYDSVRHVFYVSMFQLRVTSIDVKALKAKYPLPALIRGISSLLDDTTRDWYANLLLYQLSGKPNAGAMGIQSREKWLLPVQKGSSTTFRGQDIEMWKKYESELSGHSHK
jgi:hypothetical protein